MTDNNPGVIYCNECKKDFLISSIHIDKASANIDGDIFQLEYFTCPYCCTVYKVLLCEEEMYNKYIKEIKSITERIKKQCNKGNVYVVERLQGIKRIKQEKFRKYIEEKGQKYNGTFFLAYKGNKKQILYLPRE